MASYQDDDNSGLSNSGKRHGQWITAIAVSFFGLQAVLQLVLCAFLLIQIWPSGDSIRGSVDQVIFVMVAGAFGQSVAVVSDFLRYLFRAYKPENLNVGRAFQAFWAFLVRVFLGAGIALMFYAALRAGLIALVETNVEAGLNPWGTAGISMLSGMFGGFALERLSSSAQAMIGK